MEENKLAHRRTSDTSIVSHPQSDGFSASYKLAAIREALQKQKMEGLHASPFPDDEDKDPVLSTSSSDVIYLTERSSYVQSGHHNHSGASICCPVFSEMPRASRQIYREISPEAGR
jgi:hypothetical protein